ncbi:type II and III secretion system protein family protein [uncultured Sphingomonas sp.]|uniref:type II and III secretion system protein family protein n=1 Tax=uncultured Sphingomonas sp. TaxID=158754 RepID=UPI002609C57A|nr:type II and III secretion system protein family protein [uncultured Sphingomonas sp.]
MLNSKTKMRRSIGTALALAMGAGLVAATPAPLVAAAPTLATPSSTLVLSKGRGRLVNLSSPMSDLFVADDSVADVQVRSPTQLYIFAKGPGETTIYATSKGGAVVYSTNVRVGTNVETVDQMLSLAMPESHISVTPMNGLVLLTGTVSNPEDGAEAERLVQAFVGEGTQVVSRLRTAVPLQVNLQVRIAEVSRDLVKEIGVNLLTRDQTGGFMFGIAQARNYGSIGNFDTSAFPKLDASSVFGLPAGSISLPFNPATGQFVGPGGTAFDFSKLGQGAGKTNLGLAGKLFGIDVSSALDLAENDGLVTTLANPNLTALSGETASFLAGGEIPIPISQGLGQISIEYKQYGVSLSFTPTVLADGRISMRVRPEVSQLTSTGSVTLNGFQIPGITTRRAETTVELGSGQSFMIGGLLSNTSNNNIDKAPGIGDVPVVGALFRSTRFRRNETELMIVVTPYLVKPVSADQIVLPTDGYKNATDAERVLLGRTFSGETGGKRPVPTAAPPTTATTPAPLPAPQTSQPADASGKQKSSAAAPGFSFN